MLDRRGLLIANSQQSGELPSGYTRLNYLESTGTQYIDTETLVDEIDIIKLTVARMTGASNCLFGAAYMTQTDGCMLYLQNNNFEGRFGTSTWNRFCAFPYREFCDVIYKKNSLTHNGIEYQASGDLTIGRTSKPVLLFARNYPTEIKGKINLIPALDPNNRPCMYDTVSKQPFYNAGTGEFLYG